MESMPVKIAILFSGLYLLVGMLTGVWKYSHMIKSENHQAPVYVDIAHRNSLLFSFACLVIAKLMTYSPYPQLMQMLLTVTPLTFFSLTTIGQVRQGILNNTDNIFKERNFSTTWFVYALIVGEADSIALMVAGYIYTQFIKG